MLALLHNQQAKRALHGLSWLIDMGQHRAMPTLPVITSTAKVIFPPRYQNEPIDGVVQRD
jgi:hypothetical protein